MTAHEILTSIYEQLRQAQLNHRKPLRIWLDHECAEALLREWDRHSPVAVEGITITHVFGEPVEYAGVDEVWWSLSHADAYPFVEVAAR